MSTAGWQRSSRAVRAAALIVILSFWPTPTDAGQQRWKWWQAPQVQRDLGLVPDQVARIEQVFKATWPALHRAKTELDALEQELSALIASAEADEQGVAEQIERVETARSELGRTRSMMLYQMYRVLTPGQRVALKSLHQQWERERHGAASDR